MRASPSTRSRSLSTALSSNFVQLDEHRVGQRVKQFERRAEGACHLDGFRQPGLAAGLRDCGWRTGRGVSSSEAPMPHTLDPRRIAISL